MNDIIQVKLSGPVFDGRAAGAIIRLGQDCQREVAKAAEDTWHAFMDATFRHPTGFYQSHVNIARRDRDLVVNDAGVIYGPWLEGVGSRNSPVTRFPGYFNRRRTIQHIQGDVAGICRPIVDRAVSEMNHA